MSAGRINKVFAATAEMVPTSHRSTAMMFAKGGLTGINTNLHSSISSLSAVTFNLLPSLSTLHDHEKKLSILCTYGYKRLAVIDDPKGNLEYGINPSTP